MHILLETEDKKYVDSIVEELLKTVDEVSVRHDEPITNSPPGACVVHYKKEFFPGPESEDYRYSFLHLATKGVVYFTDKEFTQDTRPPTYVGVFREPRMVVEAARYAKMRSDLFEKLPVFYFGRTFTDPKNVLVIDHKGLSKNNDLIEAVLLIAPDNWWNSVAFVSTGNTSHLDKLFDDTLYYSQPVALTPAALAKLKHVGVDFVDASEIDLDSKRGGLTLREYTRRDESMSLTME